MRGLLIGSALTFLFAAPALASCVSATCDDKGTCGPAAGTPTEAGVDGSSPACNPATDTTCVSNDKGIFVDGANGSDANPGTKEAPFKTIATAVSKVTSSKPNVYVCEGTYAEHVKLTSTTNLLGGFTCVGTNWLYSTQVQPKIAPSDAGYALEVRSASDSFGIQDLAFASVAGNAQSPSSVAAFVTGGASVILQRVTIAAGAGFEGLDEAQADPGALMSSTPTSNTLNGNAGGVSVAGFAQTCTCAGGGNSVGGGGGNTGADGTAGALQPGSVALTVAEGASKPG